MRGGKFPRAAPVSQNLFECMKKCRGRGAQFLHFFLAIKVAENWGSLSFDFLPLLSSPKTQPSVGRCRPASSVQNGTQKRGSKSDPNFAIFSPSAVGPPLFWHRLSSNGPRRAAARHTQLVAGQPWYSSLKPQNRPAERNPLRQAGC